ncbi:MAG: trypsin-like peptidase domain-containing protein [Chitinophagales bacterium]|jgi:serine protease Do
MQDIIEKYRAVIVQIATPFNTGTGFIINDEQLVVTNFHVVEDCQEVAVEGLLLGRQLMRVVYVDRKYDLAFLSLDKSLPSFPAVQFRESKTVRVKDSVIALGHPFGLQFSAKTGYISNCREMINGVPYLHIDIGLNPGNSGGPLIDEEGFVVGINTFVMRDSDSMGFALPSELLIQAMHAFKEAGGKDAARCTGCSNTVTEATCEEDSCTVCGAKVQLPSKSVIYKAQGVAGTVERLIERLGYLAALSRCGPNAWEIRKGSAKIAITYHEKSGLISADAVLCQLPERHIKRLYEYLLRENYSNNGMTLSVYEQDILLSLLIYDRYLDEETGSVLFNQLFERADYYDNVLVEQFDALWKTE